MVADGVDVALPSALQVALKEWAVVCRALEQGRQAVLLRKGGIHESAGEFDLENRAFLLFPTYLHQSLTMLKPTEHAGFELRSTEPEQVSIRAAGEVTNIVRLQSRQQVDAIDDEHVWAAPLIDMRFNYRPDNPLYLLLVRVYRLEEPLALPNIPAYAGCKSWVPLDQPVDLQAATPIHDDAAYDLRRTSILHRVNAAH